MNKPAPSEPLTLSAFSRYWDVKHPTLRVEKKGSDFYDHSTSTQNDIDLLKPPDPRYACRLDLLKRHRDEAHRENDNYRAVLNSV